MASVAQDEDSMEMFEQAFAAKGFVYRSREPMTSTGKWADEYERSYKGKRVSIEPHLARISHQFLWVR